MIIGVSGKILAGKDELGKIIQYLTSELCLNYSYNEFLRIQNTMSSVPNKWEVKKFADKLKDIVCLLLNCKREQLEDRSFKEATLGSEWDKLKNLSPGIYELMTPRKLLQLLGTDCGRKIIHPNIWVNALMTEYYEVKGLESVPKERLHLYEGPKWIITDVRFPNETNIIKEKNGINIRINRPRIIKKQFSSDEKDYIEEVYDPNNKAHVDLLKGEKILNPEHESETALDDYKFDYVIENSGTIEDLIHKVKLILEKENLI